MLLGVDLSFNDFTELWNNYNYFKQHVFEIFMFTFSEYGASHIPENQKYKLMI